MVFPLSILPLDMLILDVKLEAFANKFNDGENEVYDI